MYQNGQRTKLTAPEASGKNLKMSTQVAAHKHKNLALTRGQAGQSIAANRYGSGEWLSKGPEPKGQSKLSERNVRNVRYIKIKLILN